MQQYSICKIGGRSQNDDTAAFEKTLFRSCAFVGDGLGAYAGGFKASQTAAKKIMECWHDGSFLDEENLISAAEAAHQAVLKLQEEEKGSMKTTLVTLTLERGKARWMHVGDSRLYHFEDGKILSQTRDHSLSQVAAQLGDIKPSEIRFHEDRNKVLRALGGGNAKAEVSQTVKVHRGHDVFLMCTDGFWEYVYEEEMEATLQEAETPQQWIEAMEKLLLARVDGTNDNYTALAVFC